MNQENTAPKLYNVGISYKKADVKVRGTFSITKENQILLLKEAKQKGIDGVFVLSTCNRTEITGFAKHPFELISLLIKYSNGSVESFIPVSNVFKNKDAVRHLFRIGTGLESQILGDYEIVGQLKQAYKQAKKLGTINAYLERLMNLVLQASKDVKNHTKLSSGTTSVAYAAIQYIMENVENYNQKNILIYGLGKIGQNSIKNILEYTDNKNVTIINRTKEKAEKFAVDYEGIKVEDFKNLEKEINKADILIVATGANQPTVTVNQLNKSNSKLIIDLSIPSNVELEVKNLENYTLINVDELSKITDKTLQIRESEIPYTEEIIEKYKAEFNEWIAIRKYVPAVNALKESLQTIQYNEIDFHSRKVKDFNVEHAEMVTSRMIQKITTQFVKHLKDENTSVDQSIDVISKMFHINELSIHEDN
jgi:glutamyl-tRNA reductase